MLFKKMWRTMGLYKAQFISMIIMIAIGVGVFVGFNMEWVSIEENTDTFFEQTGYADFRIISENGFNDSDLNAIKSINGVQNAAEFISVAADVKENSGNSVSLTVTTDENISGMLVVSGEKYDKTSTDGIWLSDKYAAANNINCGDTITLVYKNIEFKGKVKGLIKSGEYLVCVRDETQLMPDYNTYGFAYISPAMYKNAVGFEFYPQIHVLSDMDKKDFVDAADDVLKRTNLILSKKEASSYSLANGEAEEGKTMGSVLPVLFLLIAVLTMVTTMHRLAAKEKIQIGTLKALGFKDRRILVHYTSYAFMIGIIGSAVGTALGYAVAWYIMNPNGMMGTYMDMPEWNLRMPTFCIITLICIISALTLIGFLSVKQMLKGTAADALRPYSPKRFKPLLIEKTKLFHKLPFGTRWNLRDIMRHKSRTGMSLLGIVGCTILIVGGLGMRDTMNAFLDTYYSKATNYSSRIYVSESTSDEECNELKKKYNADSGASVSIQLNDKAVSLDIYDITHDTVRFPDNESRDGFLKLDDSSAFVCRRIAKDNNLSIGDKIEISPYGSDEKYTLTVGGIMRSVSENIVISRNYADKLGVSYKINSLYTNTEKSDIALQDSIKSIQSKQMIIDSFDTFTGLMDSMIVILIGGALILGIVVLYNLGVMSYTERYREMATLKVVGFRDKKIGNLLIGQNLWLSIIGILIGIPCGIGVLSYLLTALAGEYEMSVSVSPATFIITIILTVGMSLLVSFMISRKNKKINMAEALKGAE